jgi:hypothetical protein
MEFFAGLLTGAVPWVLLGYWLCKKYDKTIT